MDFHYDGVDYSIPGNTQILLTQLIETMHITVPDGDEDPENDPLLDVHDVESVKFSDEHLVEVTQVSGLISIYGTDGKLADVDAGDYNFLLSSLAPFSTEEKLTITLKDGTVIEVGVTDANDVGSFDVRLACYDYDEVTPFPIPSNEEGEKYYLIAVVGNSLDANYIKQNDLPWYITQVQVDEGDINKTVSITSFSNSKWHNDSGTSYNSEEHDKKLKIRLVHTNGNIESYGSLQQLAEYQTTAYDAMMNGGIEGYDFMSTTGLVEGKDWDYEINIKRGNVNEFGVKLEFDQPGAITGDYYVLLDATSQDGNNHYYKTVKNDTDGTSNIVHLPVTGNWSSGQKYSENWSNITAKIITPNGNDDLSLEANYTNASKYSTAYYLDG